MRATRTAVGGMYEENLQDTVLSMCKLLGLYVAHFRPARTATGWRTAVSGDGKGFPDLVITGPGGVLFRELKRARQGMRAEQLEWSIRLTQAGADWGLWRPADLHSGLIEAELKACAEKRSH